MVRIGVDVGGMNIDFVFECVKGVFYYKVLIMLKNQLIGVVQGVRGICDQVGIDLFEVEIIVYGIIIVMNIIIEYNGVECGMIIIYGFCDILYIGCYKWFYNFSLYFDVFW